MALPLTQVEETVIRQQLARLLASPRFASADRLRRFLSFVVERRLMGEADEIKEIVIAAEVYGRSQDYNPKVDSTVRVEASRLRSRLREYYDGEGAKDPVQISIPKGTYVPEFTFSETEIADEGSRATSVPVSVETIEPPARRHRSWIPAFALASVLAIGGAYLTFSRVAQRSDPDSMALAKYVEGRELLARHPLTAAWDGHVPPHVERAMDALEQAVSFDPRLGRGWATLASACQYAAEFDPARKANLLAKAQRAAEKAIAVDSSLADAHATLGSLQLYEHWDLAAAEASLRHAVELNPKNPQAQRELADVYRMQGRTSDARARLVQAQAQEPSALQATQIALTYYDERDYRRAAEEADNAVKLQPDFLQGHWAAGLAREAQGDLAGAEERYRRILLVAPEEKRALPALGHLLGRSGRRQEARAIAKKLEEARALGRQVDYAIALVWTGLKENDKALTALEAAAQKRDVSLLFLTLEQRFAPLSEMPRFRSVVAQCKARRGGRGAGAKSGSFASAAASGGSERP